MIGKKPATHKHPVGIESCMQNLVNIENVSKKLSKRQNPAIYYNSKITDVTGNPKKPGKSLTKFGERANEL